MKDMEWEVCIILMIISVISAQVFEYCPAPWKDFEDKCYKFVNVPANLQTALQNCQRDGASLVSINSHAEHDFIVQWLTENDPFKQGWYTSGKRQGIGGTEFSWEGDGTKISSYQFWVDENAQKGDGEYIAYVFPQGAHWGWMLRSPTQDLAYICEIAKTETYKIYEVDRGFGYGILEMDPQKFKRGPRMEVQPRNIIYDTDTKAPDESESEVKPQKLPVSLECVAVSNPSPSYQWYKKGKNANDQSTFIDTLTNIRYTMTNGRLTINNPEENLDYGNYYCTAENRFGSILSNSAVLSFGFLRDFSNTIREPVAVDEYHGTGIDCKPPDHYPEVFYSWYRDHIYNFIRPELKPYIFISMKGKLLFSYVTDDDIGDYYCMVFSPKQSITVSEGKVSKPIQLKVTEAAASIQEPEIASGFPSINPSNAKMGDDVKIECFAWGTGDLRYSWSKVSGREVNSVEVKMPSKVTFTDHNRVLHISAVELKDGGFYRCQVRRINGLEAHDIAELVVEALPFFLIPLEDQHLDIGQDLTWRCQADGNPSVTYAWYKNTQLLSAATVPEDDKERVIVQNNVLMIKKVDPVKDPGMYQCGATNLHGQRFSSAQLRVMAFKPSFAKFPLQPNQYATLNGNVTMRCMPESAPRATTEWKKDGAQINPGSDDNLRVRLLPNGNLFMGPVQQSDEGMYTCIATNNLGTSQSSGKLTVLSSTTITNLPRNTVVEVNKTAFLECEASFNPTLDITYIWYHNKFKIDFSFHPDPHFEMGKGVNRGGLFIKHAQSEHAGVYTCVAETTSDIISEHADLKVIGPPGEPSGVKGSEVTQNSILLEWQDGPENGRAIISYVIEKFTDNDWRIAKAKVIEEDALNKKTRVSGLSPNVTYQFRVRAENVLGTGKPSAPSSKYITRHDIPYKFPQEVGGGGGKVGDLVITWKPMPMNEWNGDNFMYLVQWRKTGSDSDVDWEEEPIRDPKVARFVNTVGSVNFYTEYDVRIRGENKIGPGPFSDPIVTIRSAMDIPVAVPTNVRADKYNSTSLIVSWDPVPDTIENMKGLLGGYRINYWKEEGEMESMSMRKTINGQADEGIVIGLDIKTYYLVNVNIWNLAGNGPKSQNFEEETLRSAPMDYPTEVEAIPHADMAVQIKWRGVSTGNDEEPLQGYKVRYWRRGESIYAAKDIDAEKETRTLVEELDDETVYNVRVLGYSLGGDGSMSKTVQFMIGQNCRTFDVILDKSVDKDYVYKCSSCAVLPSTVILALLCAWHVLNNL